MISYTIPILIIITLVVALIKRINVYNSFVLGGKEAFKLIIKIFPYIMAILIAIELFTQSGLASVFERWLSPVFTFFGIPRELTSLIIIRPLSGNGSMAVLSDIMKRYGADSYIAKCGAIIVGASETIFYVSTIYLAKTDIKKLRYTLPVALISSFIGVVASCYLARFI